jgi:predicted transposase/invertase (TIGR01784 family)
LRREVKILEILESESNKLDKENKSNKVDILAKLENNEIALIEVQIESEYDYFQRMLYGTSKIIVENICQGDEYNKVKKVYSINIVYFDLGHGKDYIYHGSTRFYGMHQKDELDLNQRQKELYKKSCTHELYPEYYLIKVNQFNDLAKDSLDEWIYFLKNEEIKDNFRGKGLKEAKTLLDELRLSKEDKLSYTKYLDNLHYQASMAATKKADMDYPAGRASGLAEGRVEGEKIGLEKGKIEGEKNTLIKTAKKMKEMKLPITNIQSITGLNIEEIEKL